MSDAVLASRPAAMPSAVPAPWRMAFALAALGAALVVLLATASGIVRLERRGPSRTIVVPGDRGEWVDVPRPRHAFTLDAIVLRGIASTYTARRQSVTDEREDLLMVGVPGYDAPSARLRIRRQPVGVALAPSSPLFAAVAREAAETGFAIERAGLADLMPTRFGAFEVLDLSLADGITAPVACTGFRLAIDRPAVTIGGFACGALGRPIERTALACLLDRVALTPGDDDGAMIEFFAAAEARHDPACAETPPAAGSRQATSRDDKPVTEPKSLRRH